MIKISDLAANSIHIRQLAFARSWSYFSHKLTRFSVVYTCMFVIPVKAIIFFSNVGYNQGCRGVRLKRSWLFRCCVLWCALLRGVNWLADVSRQTHSPVKWLPSRTATLTHPSETSPAPTPSTCSWESAWPGAWLPSTIGLRAPSFKSIRESKSYIPYLPLVQWIPVQGKCLFKHSVSAIRSFSFAVSF